VQFEHGGKVWGQCLLSVIACCQRNVANLKNYQRCTAEY